MSAQRKIPCTMRVAFLLPENDAGNCDFAKGRVHGRSERFKADADMRRFYRAECLKGRMDASGSAGIFAVEKRITVYVKKRNRAMHPSMRAVQGRADKLVFSSARHLRSLQFSHFLQAPRSSIIKRISCAPSCGLSTSTSSAGMPRWVRKSACKSCAASCLRSRRAPCASR